MLRRRRERKAAEEDPSAVLDVPQPDFHLLAHDDPERLRIWNEYGRPRLDEAGKLRT